MAKKPYRKCPKCEKWVPMQRDTCECGCYVGSQIPAMVDEAEIDGKRETEPVPEKETGDENKYVQRCPNCGKDFFLKTQGERLDRCPNCGKARIRVVEPQLIKKEEPKIEEVIETDTAKETEEEAQKEQVSSWDILFEKLQKVTEPKNSPKLTLESVGRFAGFQIALEWSDVPVMLGREADYKEFLAQDIRVSGKHCELSVEKGAWMIRDNHSKNSTLLNEKAISSEKAVKLTKGDSIVLGNQIDSMEFKVVAVS